MYRAPLSCDMTACNHFSCKEKTLPLRVFMVRMCPQHSTLTCTLVALLLLFSSVLQANNKPPVTASLTQQVHPVLIRNPHNPLLRIRLNVHVDSTVIHAFTLNLEGSDHPDDIKTLQIFETGSSSTFATARRYADPLQPSTHSIRFPARRVLNKGTYYFWVSCQIRSTASLLNRVDVTCTSIETSQEKVVPIDKSPHVRKRIGIALRRHNDAGVHTHRIPAITRTPNGTLLCVYDLRRRKSRDLQEDIDIGLSRSTDGGQTWAPAKVIMDMGEYGNLPQEQNGCSDPGIIVDYQTGEIFVSAVWMYGKLGKHQWNGDGSEPGYEIGTTAQFLMVRSVDDGQSWSPPKNFTRQFKKEAWWLFAPSPSQGINLMNGTLVMPSQGRDEKGLSFSNLMFSRNHGKTWTISKPAPVESSECQAVQLPDGSIMLNMRSEGDIRYRTVYVTHDLGTTWIPHETNQNTLIEPNCNGSLIRVAYPLNGQSISCLIFANPHSQTARDHQTIQVSLDNGRTWPRSVLLDVGRGNGYPNLTRINDEHLGIVYEGSQANLVFQKLSLQELIEGTR